MTDIQIPEYIDPIVRGEHVTVLGPMPESFKGLGHIGGQVLVEYPDGELGAVRVGQISEGEPRQ